jgi:choline dehydrogenase-like flavoprotein
MGLSGAKLDDEIRRRAARMVQINAFHEILPDPDNRLVLSAEKDALGLPKAEIVYDVGDYVRRGGERTRATFLDLARRMGGQEVVVSDAFAPNNHIMGSVIMGASGADSVVDKDCRTFDHPNLFLSTSGVMPAAGSVNCTLTIAALALRMVDTIKEDLRHG